MDVLEDEDDEAVVEALDARLLATVETEREETSPSSALVAETREQSAELRAAVEELRNEAKAREREEQHARLCAAREEQPLLSKLLWLRRCVALDVLTVFSGCGRPQAVKLAARQRRLEHGGRVDATA